MSEFRPGSSLQVLCLLLVSMLGAAVVIAQEDGKPAGQVSTARPRAKIEVARVEPRPPKADNALALARAVKIHRDSYGVPHINGETDAAVVFGFAYAQAEDYFWQIEDSYILSLGRYSEVHGSYGLNSDLLNRAFEIVPNARQDYQQLEPEMQLLCQAFTAGLNYYLATHPEVEPRLIKSFEPWQVLAYNRHVVLELTFRHTRLHGNFLPRTNPNIMAAVGSNAWAIAPRRTKNGNAMLFANPHQPWFGFGQLYEAHLRSGEGWNFSGATFFGCPLPLLGHNEHLGWSLTTNEPDIADVWYETFDNPQDPLLYRHGGEYLRATEWTETIGIKNRKGVKEKAYTFRKTHHGPVVGKDKTGRPLTVSVARLNESMLPRQLSKLMRAKTLDDFKAAMGMLELPYMNAVYADKLGNIYYLYNGAIPRRDPQFDWSKPVDGANPLTNWQGYHALEELPQVLNPPSGYVQNCNSTPFTTTDDGSPLIENFPEYMIEDRLDDKRRAQLSRQMLREMYNLDFDGLQAAVFDTTLLWAQTELPRYQKALAALEQTDPKLAEQIKPFLDHLLDWNHKISVDSTQATLCTAWYEELHGSAYPGEIMRKQYADDMVQQLKGLVQAAILLQSLHGDWRVPWGSIHRIQRHADAADLLRLPFSDDLPSLPIVAGHGPMGIIFTQYYTPSIKTLFAKPVLKQYGVVGYTYMGVFEFGERVRGATQVQFGSSGDPESPHFMDQGQLLSEQRLKPELFYWEDVLKAAPDGYHPGAQVLPLQR